VGKILLFLVLALVVYLMIKGAARAGKRTGSRAKSAENMVACARCGVNLPRSEAFEGEKGFYCSEEHRRLGGV
jgi:uncharacterized protein